MDRNVAASISLTLDKLSDEELDFAHDAAYHIGRILPTSGAYQGMLALDLINEDGTFRSERELKVALSHAFNRRFGQ